MPSPRSGLRRPDPLAFAIAAILCAAALVVFLQHRAMATLERQTGVILHQLADQTANAVAAANPAFAKANRITASAAALSEAFDSLRHSY